MTALLDRKSRRARRLRRTPDLVYPFKVDSLGREIPYHEQDAGG